MRIGTGLALLAVGSILLFVASGWFLVAGIALMLAGAAGLWLRRRPPGWAGRQAGALGSWLTSPEQNLSPGPRVSLTDMLETPQARSPSAQQAPTGAELPASGEIGPRA
jgi:hypothetical protein